MRPILNHSRTIIFVSPRFVQELGFQLTKNVQHSQTQNGPTFWCLIYCLIMASLGTKTICFCFLTKRTNQPNMLLAQNKFIHNFLCLLGPTFGTTSNPPKAVQCVQKLYPVLCRFSAQNMTIEGATRHEIQHWNLEVTFFYHCACFSTY